MTVPKLRFPEFWNAGEWEEKQLKFICQMQAGKFVSASDISEKYQKGLYPCFGGNGLRGYTKTYTHSGNYPLIGRQGALCGNIKLGVDQFHATEHAVVTTPKDNIDVNWLFYELNFLNLNRYATGQAQPGLSVEVLEKISIHIPEIEKEQQKIADCLCSIDSLIAAETQKLDTLKAHKKGLMQKLFPAEGETFPKLRFPEFRDSGNWEEKALNKITSYVDYRGRSPIKCEQGIFLVTAKNIKQGFIDYEISREYVSPNDYEDVMRKGKPKIGDVLLTTEAPLGNVAQIDRENIALAQRVIKFRGELISSDFLKHYMLGYGFQKLLELKAIGSTVQGIQGKVLHQLPMQFPSHPEQKKITDCLSSLDDRITAQTQKIATLKTHKKGLMQQLFPAIDEVAG